MRGAAVTVSERTSWLPPLVEADGRGRRQRTGVQRVAEREVVLLDGDDVREVGADLELELERDRLGALVADGDVVLHPVADEALAHDREHVLAEAARERVAQVEGGREVLDLAGREQQRPLAVHAQLEPGEEARVVREEPGRACRRGRRCSSQMQNVDPSRMVSVTSPGDPGARRSARAPSPRSRRRSRSAAGSARRRCSRRCPRAGSARRGRRPRRPRPPSPSSPRKRTRRTSSRRGRGRRS